MLRLMFQRRRAEKATAILTAIDRLRPEWATAANIAKLGGVSRVEVRLLRLERAGRITGIWIPTSDPGRPRRRVYRRGT
jgi:hypothetical protein